MRMSILVLKEIKNGEKRVAATPADVSLLSTLTRVYVEKDAGKESGFSDDDYGDAGADIHSREQMREVMLSIAEPIVIKVKELLPPEYDFLHSGSGGQTGAVMGFGHLASNRELTMMTVARKATYLSLEDIVVNGKRPVLANMSEVAGEEAVRLAKKHLPEGSPAYILIGYGTAGRAAHRAIATSGSVPLVCALDISVGLDKLNSFFGLSPAPSLLTSCTLENFDTEIRTAIRNCRGGHYGARETPIVMILSPYIPESTAPKMIRRSIIPMLPRGSAIVDISIDQGGACEFSRATSHDEPIADINGVSYIGIPNLPGGAPLRATPMLSMTTRPFILEIARKGFVQALRDNESLRNAVSVYQGKVTSRGLAKTFGLEHAPIASLLA
ncbi:MAG: hypothetical protein A3I44_04650 [Candidatus Sungbacteria bacterium RIFCSPLOWO2_02_FULL_51_17]|uniref:Uncharacterized protein n=1 Tax=Candidatus Sungbacteria bacterium RIFCSPHIGHO2_02_FULL_51_29 TaxID=1802273 RepID=A0A1G2KVK3_9BACT|nr:MAG: hypothetical protein A2676_05375 [Candidatus Sungbacteria bacterium RIFCSPHIGHO2_01_FULL_51_22]OHA03430.1 MAG: hypothetical protein A3C16_00105 [Candidatus Sungbacteria bacterium RIFCSPHIGHO2_02_FULL_51_29]OHA07905.1 MAG: hypothetical protein A3B29_04975 [Candidatus Sungbacteria bacterium RIFCSPLOWO2_01_FULL_51_34]OHA12459.1 MAG: hypothetical protein A3I44_04650 [Candidatus Sungbacteria bacterium RIFCSPLOWO2_02_FULL_51_17]